MLLKAQINSGCSIHISGIWGKVVPCDSTQMSCNHFCWFPGCSLLQIRMVTMQRRAVQWLMDLLSQIDLQWSRWPACDILAVALAQHLAQPGFLLDTYSVSSKLGCNSKAATTWFVWFVLSPKLPSFCSLCSLKQLVLMVTFKMQSPLSPPIPSTSTPNELQPHPELPFSSLWQRNTLFSCWKQTQRFCQNQFHPPSFAHQAQMKLFLQVSAQGCFP